VTELIGLDKAPLAIELYRNRALLAKEPYQNRNSFLERPSYSGRLLRDDGRFVD